MKKEEWGTAAWKFLHTLTFDYPENPSLQQQISAEQLFMSLKDLLPCDECRSYYKDEIGNQPVDTKSKLALSSWLVDIHNRVNIRLGKPQMTFDAAKLLYGKTSGQCTSCNSSIATTESIKPHVSNNANWSKKDSFAGLSTIILALILAVALYYYIQRFKKTN